MNKRCVVNVFTIGRENYAKGTERLVSSLYESGYDGDLLVFSPDSVEEYKDKEVIVNEQLKGLATLHKALPFTDSLGVCRSHKEAPYQFKSFAIQHARELGYEQIVWMDSSIVIKRSLDTLFYLSNQIGVVLFDNPGCIEAVWTADDCLELMGCSPKVANQFFQIDAAVMFFDFTKKKAKEVFNDYLEVCLNPVALRGDSGSNRPEYSAHRHDQSILSYIARIKNYVLPLNYGVWSYGYELQRPDNDYNPTFCKVGIV